MVRYRSLIVPVVLVVFLIWAASPASGKYRMPDLVNVPVERLVKNLEELVKKDAKDVQARHNLARVHAMAYALKIDTAEARKNQENDGAWFGYEPAHVPFTLKPTDEKTKDKIAKAHLSKAILRYAEVLKLDPDHGTAALGHAWCLEQSGEKDKAIKGYRKVIVTAWTKEKDLKRGDLGWHSITAEAAGYLIPLLDKEKDEQEIETLRSRIKLMNALPRPMTPLVIPLRAGLTARDLEDHSVSVPFDADGTGLKKRWTWITRDAGWLVYDPLRTGQVKSALQMFGSVTFWTFWDNGYQALAALDDDGDGLLTGKELQGLAIWQDLNGDGVCDPGEVKPLSAWGIVALSCRCSRDPEHPDRILHSPRGVVFRDGSTRPTYDIILRPR